MTVSSQRRVLSFFSVSDGLFLLEFLEAAAGVTGIGVEFEGLLVVADGGIGHVLVLALAAHDGVFGGQALQQFALRVEFRLQGLEF